MKRKILHVGLTPPDDPSIFHCPLIAIAPRSLSDKTIQIAISHLEQTTHLIFTSKTAVRIFSELIDSDKHSAKQCMAVGSKTAAALHDAGFMNVLTAKEETAEGIADLIRKQQNQNHFYFWGHAAKSRLLIAQELQRLKIRYTECVLYDTIVRVPKVLPNLDEFDEIIFTSPSSVEAFLKIFGPPPKDKILISIGPITRKKLEEILI